MAIVTVKGTVTRSVSDSRNCSLKETYIHSYTPANGQTVTKEATRYWTIWFAKPHSISENTEIEVTGEYATVSGEPKADGKVWPNHKLNGAYIGQNPADVHPVMLNKEIGRAHV